MAYIILRYILSLHYYITDLHLKKSKPDCLCSSSLTARHFFELPYLIGQFKEVFL